MFLGNKLRFIKLSLVLSLVPVAAQAYEYGPPWGSTGAPGEQTCIQSGCHLGTPNTGTGSVKILLPAGNTGTYTPGQTMKLLVQISDATKKAYGFEMTARLANNTTAGQFATADANTQLICADGSDPASGPCPSQFPIEEIEHTDAGFNASISSSGAFTYTMNWTPPASAGSGNVTLYVAANCGVGLPAFVSPTNVYLANLTLTPAAASSSPAISPSGVVAHGGKSTTIEPGSFIDIYGANLSQTPMAATFNGNFPTTLNNVSVMIDNKPAYVYYVSSGLINVQAPDDTALGTVNVTVTNSAGTSTPVTATIGAVGPTYFTLDGKYAAAVIPAATGFYLAGTANSYDLLGPAGLYSFNTRPVKKGEVLELYAGGFGAGMTPVPAGKVYASATQTIYPVTVTIGGVSQTVNAYIVGAGLWQMNVTIPQTVASGDNILQATVDGVQTPAGVYVTVQ